MLKRLFGSLSALLVVFILSTMMAIPVFADDLDGLTGDGTTVSQDAGSSGQGVGALGEALQDYNPVSDENVANAQEIASPIVNLIGNAVGVITLVVGAAIFLITAIDFIYIGLPPFRGLLTSRWQLPSDEAIAVVQPPMQNGMQNGMAGGMNGMSGGMGGMGMRGGMGMNGMSGGMGMNGMGGMAGGMNGMQNGMQNGQQMPFKSCITAYLKKRVVFLVIFTIALILLTSSAITGMGINLAALLFKVIEKINEMINGISI